MSVDTSRHAADLHKQRAVAMSHTNWTIGTDKASWTTEANAKMKAPRYVKKIAKTKPNKNASDSRDIFGDAKISSRQHFATQHRSNFAPEYSATSDKYTRRKPYPGFDRRTANRTNYSLGLGRPTLYESENSAKMCHPSKRSVAKSPTYKARVDMPKSFDIVTGISHKAGSTFRPKMMRSSQDFAVSSTTRKTAYNIINGRQESKRYAPPVKAYGAEKPPLRTLIAVRPPSGGAGAAGAGSRARSRGSRGSRASGGRRSR